MKLAGRSRRVRVLAALVVLTAVAAALVQRGRGQPATSAAPQVVSAERGDVAITVGGLGHINTLAGAARVATPATSGASAGGGPAAVAASAGAATPAPADAVFPALAGHVTRLLVHTGQRVAAGQPIATLSDDGTTATGVLQARSDLAAARLELAQKRIQDPVRGQPPTPAERASAQQAVLAARAKLTRLAAPPLAADVAAARLEVARAAADLSSARAGAPDAVAASELAVTSARQRLALLTGAPSTASLSAARLELAKATVDQEQLLRPAPSASPAAISAADLAIAAAQQRLADAQSAGASADVASARADLAKAQSERDALSSPAAPPSAAAQLVAQLAIDVAQQRLDELLHPPSSLLSAAQGEVVKAQADLAALRATRGAAGVGAARAAVLAARAKLQRLRRPAQRDVLAGARLEVRKAQADLAILRQRGAPAGAIDLALARLKVEVGAARLALATQLTGRLTVRATARGTVTSVLTSTGAAVDAATPVARVADTDHLVVTLDLSEFDVSRTRVGAAALVTVDALPDRQFGGRVIDVGRTGTDSGGVVNFPVMIALHARGALRPGMTASARIDVVRHRSVVRLPRAAVSGDGASASVLVSTRGVAAARRSVRLGLRGSQFVEVRSGLRPGERVVSAPGGE